MIYQNNYYTSLTIKLLALNFKSHILIKIVLGQFSKSLKNNFLHLTKILQFVKHVFLQSFNSSEKTDLKVYF